MHPTELGIRTVGDEPDGKRAKVSRRIFARLAKNISRIGTKLFGSHFRSVANEPNAR